MRHAKLFAAVLLGIATLELGAMLVTQSVENRGHDRAREMATPTVYYPPVDDDNTPADITVVDDGPLASADRVASR